MNGEDQEPDRGGDSPKPGDSEAVLVEPGFIVRRPRTGTKPGQRSAIHALKPARSLLLSALFITLFACAFAVLLWGADLRPPTGLLIVAAMALPLGIATWHFPRRPLLVSAWIMPAALVAVGAFTVLLCVSSDVLVLPLRMLLAAYLFFGWVKHLPACERKAIDAVREYQEAGGEIEDLYRTADPEDRRLVNPTALVIVAFVLLLGVAGLWSVSKTLSAANSRPGIIGIGGS